MQGRAGHPLRVAVADGGSTAMTGPTDPRPESAGVGRGDHVGVAVAPDGGLVVALPGRTRRLDAAALPRFDEDLRPRWVWWSPATPDALVRAGVRLATCWDVAAVHRLLFGGWRADPATAWAAAHGLDPDTIPLPRQPDLFSPAPDPEELEDPLDAGGHLRPEWIDGGWSATPSRLRRWAELALVVAARQLALADALPGRVAATARSESTAELLCVELSADGLPVDRVEAERIIAALVGPRPRTPADADLQRAARDAAVLRHAPPGGSVDLRRPDHVRSLLRRVGLDVPDTRAWRLEAHRDDHPLVAALLSWRKAERMATTYGYDWLDAHVGDDGRLRGQWTGSDGAAGRMTATAGLHNMPADLRRAVVAEPGHVFVRADLGQIEPRVLAAVSGDLRLAHATSADDIYAPVAEQLGVDRATAKVAVLGAMYGQTTGHGAQALRRLESAYPVAMGYLHDADVEGQVGRDVRTIGGRLIRMGTTNVNEVSEQDARRRAAARGRYARNALVQGAAAELFKMWAVTVRARLADDDARIVLCLHDELLVHVPGDGAEATAALVGDCLQEAAARWAPGTPVRFVAEISAIRRWSDAKS